MANIDNSNQSDQESGPFDLEQRPFAENSLVGKNPAEYRALVISEKNFSASTRSGVSIIDGTSTFNLSVDVSSTEDMNFKQTGASMLSAIVQSSVPYTIARTAGHITIIFGYQNDEVPTIELTGGLRNCDFFYANPTDDTVIDKDGEVEDLNAQTGSKGSIPLQVLTHLAALTAGYMLNQNGPGEEDANY